MLSKHGVRRRTNSELNLGEEYIRKVLSIYYDESRP